jgi:hypothetical protein
MSDSNPNGDNVVLLNAFRSANNQIRDSGPVLNLGDGGGTFDAMSNERLAKLEGAVEGLRATQSVLLGAIGLVLTVVIAFGVYTVNRLDALSNRVNDLPGQISSNLRDLTGTLSQAITATRQQNPQVILMTAPELLPAPAQSSAPQGPVEKDQGPGTKDVPPAPPPR